MKIGLPKKQKGAAAIEFALVFVVFFAVLYGVLSYSLPLLLMQSFNNATAEAVRRSVAVDPALAPADYAGKVVEVAEGVLDEKLKWVPAAVAPSLVKTASYNPATGVLTATVTLESDKLGALMPVLKLGTITVPQLPTTLTAQSSMKF